jgi:hypothetical protein
MSAVLEAFRNWVNSAELQQLSKVLVHMVVFGAIYQCFLKKTFKSVFEKILAWFFMLVLVAGLFGSGLSWVSIAAGGALVVLIHWRGT